MAISLPLKVILQGVDNLTGPLRKGEAGLGKFGSKASMVGRKMSVGLTAPIALFAATTISTGVDFQKSMNRVQALSGTTGEKLDGLRMKARELGRDTAFSAGQSAEAMTFLAQAGFKFDDIVSSIGPTLDLAAAGNTDLATTADILSDALRGFGEPATSATKFADIYAAAITNATTDLVTFQEGMKLVNPVAKGMNNSILETATLMAAVSDAGLKGTVGGTALKQSFVALMKPSLEAKRALFDLGIPRKNILDSEGRVLSLMGTLNDLSAAGATPGQVLDIFGKRALPAVLALTERGGEGLKALQAELKKSGTAAKIQQIQMQGAPGEVAKLRAAFDELKLAILDSGLLKAFTGIVTTVKDLILQVAGANPLLLKGLTIFAGILAVVGPVIMVIGALSSGLGVLAGIFSTVLIPVVTTFFAILLGNPIGLIITAIVALTAAAISLMGGWGKVGQFFKNLFKGLVSVFEWYVGLILDGLDFLFSFIPDFVKEELGIGEFKFRSILGGREEPEIAAQDVVEAGVATQVTRAESTLRLEVEGKDGASARVLEERGDLPIDIDLGGTMLATG
jgi:TP901 family phage tail tape measure protein